MPVEIIGWIAPRVASEIISPSGAPFEKDVIAHTALVHETAGFDRVLIGYFSDAPDGFLVGAHAASVTERLGLLLAHRPGFVARSPITSRMMRWTRCLPLAKMRLGTLWNAPAYGPSGGRVFTRG